MTGRVQLTCRNPDCGPLVRIRDQGEIVNAYVLSATEKACDLRGNNFSPEIVLLLKNSLLQKLLRDSLWKESCLVLLHNEQHGCLKNQSHASMQCERPSLLSQKKSCAKLYSSNIFCSLNQAMVTHRLWLRNETSLFFKTLFIIQ